MKRLKALLTDLLLALAIAVSIGTAVSSGSFSYGFDVRLVLLATASGLVWLGPALVAVWLAEGTITAVGRRLGGEWDQHKARKVLAPLLLGLVSLLQPLIGYASIGPPLLLLAITAVLWRWWSDLRKSPAGSKLPDSLEKLLEKVGDGRTALAVFAFFLVFYLVIFLGLLAPLPQPEGDEPHYIMVSYSMLTDGDLDLFNNYYENRDYLIWHDREGSPVGYAHTKKGAAGPQQEFSMHTAGLPAYLLPFLAVGNWIGQAWAIHLFTRLGMIIPAAAFLALLFLAFRRLALKRRLALGVAGLAGLTCPILFFSYHIFTELPAALLCLFAFYHLWPSRSPGILPRIFVGLALGALPWLGPKYIFLAAPLGVLWLVREIQWKWNWAKAAALVIPAFALGIFFLWHTYALFGTWNPSAFYVGAGGDILDKNPVFKVGHEGDLLGAAAVAGETALSYWVDQREGLLAFAPWLLLAVAGWIGMFSSKETRHLALWLLALIGPFYLLYSLTGFNGGHSPPARAMTAMIWALLMPAAWMVQKGFERARELTFILVILSLSISIVLLTHPTFLYHDFDVPASHILSRLSSPFLDLTHAFPSVNSKHFEIWWVTALWCVALAGIVTWLLLRGREKEHVQKYRWAGTGILLLAASVILWAALAITPPLQEKHYSHKSTPVTVHFQPHQVYVESETFWVRTETTAQCYTVSPQPDIELQISLRTVVPNIVYLHSDAASTAVRLIESKNKTLRLKPSWHFSRGNLHITRLAIESTRGVPEDSDFLPDDNRALGVEVSIKN